MGEELVAATPRRRLARTRSDLRAGLEVLAAPSDSGAVEGAVRDLVAEGLLTIEGGKVVPGSAWVSDFVNP